LVANIKIIRDPEGYGNLQGLLLFLVKSTQMAMDGYSAGLF